ncbi:MAG: hypothetical protein ACYC0M_12125 [Burkholderiales bacterium]
MNQSAKKIMLYVGLLMVSSISLASSMDEYSSVKPLLLQALDDPEGKSQGEIVGKIADKIQTTTKSTSPVIATVTTLKHFKQVGCSRLNLRLQQANVPTNSGKFTDFAMDYGINLCKNGDPPTEGMDLSKVAPMLEDGGVK